jgi:hypothetical protein
MSINRQKNHTVAGTPQKVISVGQGLLILLEKYRGHEKYKELKELYLLGGVDTNSLNKIRAWMKDPCLSDYVIDERPSVINSDATRRYFESHLAFEALQYNIKKLNFDCLKLYRENVLSLVAAAMPDPKWSTLILAVLAGDMGACAKYFKPYNVPRYIGEYIEAINSIASEQRYSNYSVEDKLKINMIFHISFLAMIIFKANEKSNQTLPIALYEKGIFSSEKRGLLSKRQGENLQYELSETKQSLETMIKRLEDVTNNDPSLNEKNPWLYATITAFINDLKHQLHEVQLENNSDFKSHHLGIMKSTMPIPMNDLLFSARPSHFLRPTDASHYNIDAAWVKENFDTLVNPFSASISLTMLAQLRVMKQLENIGKKTILLDDTFIMCFTSALLFSLGGHTFREYLTPLTMLEVKDNFKDELKNFSISALILDKNAEVFDKALLDTIQYNKMILKKSALLESIKSMHKETHHHQPVSLTSSLTHSDVELIKKVKDLLDANYPAEDAEKDEAIRAYREIILDLLNGFKSTLVNDQKVALIDLIIELDEPDSTPVESNKVTMKR